MQNNSMPKFGEAASSPEPKKVAPPVYSGDPFFQQSSNSFHREEPTPAVNPAPNPVFNAVPSQSSSQNFGQTLEQTPSDQNHIANPILENSPQRNNFVSTQNSATSSFDLSAQPTFQKPSIDPNKDFSSAPSKYPVQKESLLDKLKSRTVNEKLVFLSVILGVIALISTTIAVWSLVNKPKTSVSSNNGNSSSSISTSDQDYSAKALGFYPSKIVNPDSDIIYRLGKHRTNAEGKSVIGAYINTENSAIEVYVYWEYVKDFYGVDSGKNERELFTVPFDKKIADIAFAESGQSTGGDVIIVLLSDGTVHYIPVLMSLQTRSFQTSGQLNGVAEVVKFYKSDAVSDTGDLLGYTTTLAQRADGTIIDLQSFLISATSQGMN